MRYTEAFRENWIGLAVLIGLEVLRHVFDRLKFGKSAAYHMWSAKLWGISLFLGFSELFLTGSGGVFFKSAVVLGIVTDVEGLLASMVLREWAHDVPSLVHALALRKRTEPEIVR